MDDDLDDLLAAQGIDYEPFVPPPVYDQGDDPGITMNQLLWWAIGAVVLGILLLL